MLEEKKFKAVGKIRCYPDTECVVVESLDDTWRCLVPISSIKAKITVFGSIPVVNVIHAQNLDAVFHRLMFGKLYSI